MSYNTSTAVITAPVNIHDLQVCLGTDRQDLGDIIDNAFDDGVINVFARFKPIVYPSKKSIAGGETGLRPYFNNTVSVQQATGLSGLNCNAATAFGVTTLAWGGKQVSTFISEVIQVMLSDRSKMQYRLWSCQKPLGGVSSPYRLTDFAVEGNANVGYNAKAELEFSFQNSARTNWYSLEPYFNIADDAERVERRKVNIPETTETIEEAIGIQSCWENYELNNQGKAVATLVASDMNIRVQDLIVGNSSPSVLKNMRHGILFYCQDDPSYHYVFVNTLPFGENTAAMNSVRSNLASRYYAYVEFYTNAPDTGTVPMNLQNTNAYTWIPIPCCCGLIKFNTPKETGGIIVYSSGIWDADGTMGGLVGWFFEALVYNIDFSAWNSVKLILAETPSSYSGLVERPVTQNNQMISFTIQDDPQNPVYHNGDVYYLNLVGVKKFGGQYVVINSEMCELSGYYNPY